MRISFKIPVMVLILLAAAVSVYAQGLPAIAIDSSFRVEYLLGNLQSRYSPHADPDAIDRLKIDLNAQVAVLSGVVEVTPFPIASGRLLGSISVWERSGSFARPRDHRFREDSGSTIDWQAKPDFSQWEVAGLYHLWNAAGYRFSFTAGYRQEKWTFNGEPTGLAQGSLRDEYTSSIPFIGLQTSMLFPWWKARFEVLGSPFMNKRLVNSFSGIDRSGTPIGFQTDGSVGNGGLIEFQMEGSVGLSPTLFVGANASYTYQELYGDSTVRSAAANLPPIEYRLYTSESIFRLGFDVNILF